MNTLKKKTKTKPNNKKQHLFRSLYELNFFYLCTQYYADANEAESWMKEKMPLVTSDDYGKDEASAKALLSRHNRLEGEIKAFGSEIKRLDELAQLMTKAASEHNVSK